jgi:hypothetical protein
MAHKTASEVLSADTLKTYLQRFLAGTAFDVLLAEWQQLGLAKATLKDLLRGCYATEQAAIAYQELGYERRSIRFAPRNFRAKLLAPQLLDIRRRVRAGEAPTGLALFYGITQETVRLIIDGSYSSLAMAEALAAETEAQQ